MPCIEWLPCTNPLPQVSYKSYGRVGGYEMCKNFASMEESEDLGQLTIF